MDVVPFKAEHLAALQLQAAQAHCMGYLTDELIAEATDMDARTALVDGRPVAIAGLLTFWPGRAMAWSYIGANAGPHMTAITRAVKSFLDSQSIRRVEAYVDPDFEAGRRWMPLLGFGYEGELRRFFPDGRDALLFSRIHDDG